MATKTLIETLICRIKLPKKPIPTCPNAKPRLLSTKPYFSNQSHYRKQISVANIFNKYGFSPSQVLSFIKANHFLLKSNLLDIERSLSILSSFNIPRRLLLSLIIDCPVVLELEFLKKWEMCFSNCGGFCVPPLLIKSVLAYSKRFQIDPDGFSTSFNVLKGFGFGESTVRKVFEEFPDVITMKGSDISSRIELLMRIGIPRNDIDWIFNSYPSALGFLIEDRMMRLMNEFADLGFSKEVVVKEIIREPRVLGLEIGEFSMCMKLLNSLKCREPIKFKILSDGAFRAGFEVKLRVDCLCKHGLIRRESFKVLWKEPRTITYDIEDIEKKIEFLVNTMKFSVGCLAEVPEYLGINFEKQVVPRYNVIEYLRAKGGLGHEVGLRSMIKLSRLKFYNLYVKPYPECEKLYGRFSDDISVKGRHPVGLWKMFKPQVDPDSKQDVNNMKSFMEGLV